MRTLLGITKETTKFHLDKSKLDDFDVFVQSTSYNRILLPDTEFLYDTGEGGAALSVATAAAVTAPVSSDEAKPEPSTSRGTGRGKRKKADDEVVRPGIASMCSSRKNPYSPHGRLSEIPRVRGVSTAKILQAQYETINWNFLGGWGLQNKKAFCGGSGCFLELHNAEIIIKCQKFSLAELYEISGKCFPHTPLGPGHTSHMTWGRQFL